MTASDAYPITITVGGVIKHVRLHELRIGQLPVVLVEDPELPPGEARVVGETAVRITGIGDTPTE